MSIETDIKQRAFRSNFQRAIINLIYTHNWMMAQIKDVLEKGDITPQQFNIMRILRGAKGPLSTLQIRQRMLDKMSDTSRIVDRLVLKGWAKKVVCQTDKRLVDVTITDEGLKLLEQIDVYQDNLDGVLHNISDEEAITLSLLLDKIRNSI